MLASLLVNSPPELTTSATDAVLAIECVVASLQLLRAASQDRWRVELCASVFGVVTFSSALGAVADGLDLSNTVRNTLWKPLYLNLGVNRTARPWVEPGKFPSNRSIVGRGDLI